MRYKLLLVALLCSALASCRTEDPLPGPPPGTILFGDKTDEIAADIIELDDGNFLIVGGKEEKKSNEYDIMIVKVDQEGREIWTRILEDENRDVYGRFIRKTPEGYGILAFEAVNNTIYGNQTNLTLERYTEDFDLIRSTALSAPESYYGGGEPVSSFHITSGGSFLIETISYDVVRIQRVTSQGVPEQPIQLSNNSQGYASNTFVPSHTGGFVAANIPSYGSNELRLSFYDEEGVPTGNVQTYFLNESGQVLGLTYFADSTYLVALTDYSYGSGSISLAHLNLNGTLLEQITLDNDGSFTRIFTNADGSINLFGNSNVNYGNNGSQQTNALVINMDDLNSDDDVTSYGGSVTDGLKNVLKTSNGRYAIVGFTRSFGSGGSDASLIFYQP